MKTTTMQWCLGRDVAVTILLEDGTERKGTVTALDPRQLRGSEHQPRGLFLNGAVLGRTPIKQVITSTGKNVTPYLGMSFGPGL